MLTLLHVFLILGTPKRHPQFSETLNPVAPSITLITPQNGSPNFGKSAPFGRIPKQV